MTWPKKLWTHPLAIGVEDDSDNSPLLSPTERGGYIAPRRTKRIRKPLIIATLATLTAVLAITATIAHQRFRVVASPPTSPFLAALLARQSTTYAQAAARYSLKTGRAPPRNWDKWFTFAQEHSCLIDEYDQIHRDFAPFYQLAEEDPLFFQRRVDIIANVPDLFPTQINNHVREAGAVFIKDGQFAHLLPDMSFIINGKDQPRVVFDYSAPGKATRERALVLKDERPFDLSPRPSADFFRSRPGCQVLRNPVGFTEMANDDSGFFLSSSPAYMTQDLYPVMSVTKVSPCFADILFPSEYYYARSSTSPKFAYSDNVPWEDKKSQIYWRGTATGGQILNTTAYRNFTRFKLVDIARQHPDLIDAQITKFADALCLAEDGCDRGRIMEEYGITGAHTPQENAYKYKYLLDVDGMTFSGRFGGLLRVGGLVFKATLFEEYHNDWLRAGEHYIPVLPDLSDLLQKIEWAQQHDAEARKIMERGQEMAQRVMTDGQNDCYFFALLLEWGRLQEISRNASLGVGRGLAGAVFSFFRAANATGLLEKVNIFPEEI
ncbi:glycosyl transferase family 90-domain-containing protein [Mycena rebaudengoi]|nr:glycosyl transferase family 90-domain-containing protein [Mycena rebaudengoi]